MKNGRRNIIKTRISPIIAAKREKPEILLPATYRIWLMCASLEMQWAINQIGNNIVKTAIPAPGYISSITPDITLRMPGIRDR